MKVLLVVEVLHDDQVGLESFNLGREVFSDLLDCRFAAPVRCIKFRRFETSERLKTVLRRGGEASLVVDEE